MHMCQCVYTVCCTCTYGICFCGANVQTRLTHVCSRVLKHEGMQGLKYVCPASPWSLAVSDRAGREEHTSIQALENVFNTCSQEQPLKARTLRKRLSYQQHCLIFHYFLLCTRYSSEHTICANLTITNQ